MPPARRSNLKRRCAARRAARLRSDALRSVFVEAAQAVTLQARRLNSDFHEVPPPRHKGGAPDGNRNALKHGTHTRDRRALFAALQAHLAEGRALLAALKSTLSSPAERSEWKGIHDWARCHVVDPLPSDRCAILAGDDSVFWDATVSPEHHRREETP